MYDLKKINTIDAWYFISGNRDEATDRACLSKTKFRKSDLKRLELLFKEKRDFFKRKASVAVDDK